MKSIFMFMTRQYWKPTLGCQYVQIVPPSEIGREILVLAVWRVYQNSQISAEMLEMSTFAWEGLKHWSKLCNLQLPDKGDKQYVSAWKNIEFPKTSRNNLAESTLESSSLNQIFSNHSMAFSPFSPTFPSEKKQTLAHLSFLEMFWFPAQTWCQKQRRVQTWAKFTIPYHFNSHHFYHFNHFSSRTLS